MSRWQKAAWVAAGILVAITLGWRVAGAGFPLLGAGDIHFRLDHASFRSGVGTTESEFYLEVDNHELQFKEADGQRQARIELRLEFYDDGERVDRKSYPLEILDGDPTTGRSRTQVLQLRVAAPAEADSVHAWVEDRNARKRGLFHMFTQSRRAGQVGAALFQRQFPEGQLSVSDLQFVRSLGPVTETATFVKSGMDCEPNPGRVYGAPGRPGITYLEVYDLAMDPEGDERRRYEIEYRLRDQEGSEVGTWTRSLASRNPAWADTFRFEVPGLLAGTYFLGAVVKEISGEGRAAAESSFDLVWASADWVGWMAETEAIAPFLFQSLELDDFLELGPGAKERYVEDFWARHDPTPGDGNATREEFTRRIEYTNQNFSTTVEPGMWSDRGRVYIKFGEPDEVSREVIPVQGNDINAALEELERGTGGDLQGSRDIDPEDSRAFEIWVYDYRGYELFESQMSRTLGQQFVFVDDLGVGDFRMIRSSERDDF